MHRCLLDVLSPAERSTTVPDLTFVIVYVPSDSMLSLVARRAQGMAEVRVRGRARKKTRQFVKIMRGK